LTQKSASEPDFSSNLLLDKLTNPACSHCCRIESKKEREREKKLGKLKVAVGHVTVADFSDTSPT